VAIVQPAPFAEPTAPVPAKVVTTPAGVILRILFDNVSARYRFPVESLTIPDGELNIKLPKNIDTSIPLRIKSKGFKLESVGDLIVNQYIKYSRD
jgi:hypothetical protein